MAIIKVPKNSYVDENGNVRILNSLRVVKTVNTKLNHFRNFVELIVYKKDFEIWSGALDYELIDDITGEKVVRGRSFEKVGDLLKPLHDGVTIEKYEKSIRSAQKRAKENYYGYAFSNAWKYFLTATISVNEFDYSDDAVKLYWSLFRKKLQYYFPNVKIICVPERHNNERANIHFHALVGECDLSNFIKIAISKKTGKPIKTKKGNQVYNCTLWDKGFTQLCIIDNVDYIQQIKSVCYLAKYLVKDNNIGYNQKKYYRTNNLDYKNKLMLYQTEYEIAHTIKDGYFETHKDNDRFTVYRRFYSTREIQNFVPKHEDDMPLCFSSVFYDEPSISQCTLLDVF